MLHGLTEEPHGMLIWNGMLIAGDFMFTNISVDLWIICNILMYG